MRMAERERDRTDCNTGTAEGGESVLTSEKGGLRERKEETNSHIHTYMFTHINHCHISPTIGQGFLISLERTRDRICPE